jgi:hypothetical protein
VKNNEKKASTRVNKSKGRELNKRRETTTASKKKEIDTSGSKDVALL